MSADLVLANDVEALPLARQVSGRAPVVFDAHEWAPAQYEHVRWWPLLMRPQVDALLRRHLPHTAGMTTVAPGIAERYERVYGVDCTVVTNAAPYADLTPTPPHDPIRLLHHGGAQPERRLELMIDAVRRLNGHATLDLILLPTNPAYLRRLQLAAEGDEWIRFLEPRPIERLTAEANDYDAGVIFYPPLHANLELSLPNKLFDFLQARLALVIGPSPEMTRIVRDFDCGVVAADFTAREFERALRALTPERIRAMKAGADRAAEVHNAERNRDLVLELVEAGLAQDRSDGQPMTTGTSRSFLVVVHPYPPTPSSGAHRWAAMVKYLRRAGHDVRVVTSGAFGAPGRPRPGAAGRSAPPT